MRLDADGRGEDLASLDGGDGTTLALPPDQQATTREADVAALICAYPWDCAYWVGIAWCESTLGQNPAAYADWNPYVGIFQIWIAHGYGREWLKDDANNTLAAWELSRGGTYTGAWPNCR